MTAPAAAAADDDTGAGHGSGQGWGAIAHLQGNAGTYGLSSEELLVVAPPFVDGERQLGLGHPIKDLDASDRAAVEREARNFDKLTQGIATEAEHDDTETDVPGKADLLAEALSTDTSEVVMLRDADVGWGAAFKLIRFAQVMDVTAEELLAATPVVDGEYEFGFGNLKNQLTGDQLKTFQDGPRSLGHVISSANRSERAEEKAANKGDKRGYGRDKPKPDKAHKGDMGDEAGADEEADAGD